MNIDHELTGLRQLTPTQLRQRYSEVFGEAARTNNKAWLVKRIAWRLQALAEGDLSDRAKQRAAALARDADLRLIPPKSPKPHGESYPTGSKPPSVRDITPLRDDRLPAPGSRLQRHYQGEVHEVKILVHGLEYRGQVFHSLTALAKKITGSHCNGFLFFRLGRYAKGGQQ